MVAIVLSSESSSVSCLFFPLLSLLKSLSPAVYSNFKVSQSGREAGNGHSIIRR